MPTCPICSGDAVRATVTFPEDAVRRREVWRCPDCDFLFPHPAIEQKLADLPDSVYYDDWRLLDISGIPFIYNDVVATARRHGLPRGVGAPIGMRVLEAGCGAGHLLNHFRAHGWDVHGVEPWRAVAEAGRKYLKIPIEPERMETAKIEPGSQDVVLSIDVVNFVARPLDYLAACRNALKPGGMLYLVVPNAGSAERNRLGWTWNFFEPTSHMGAYTPLALRRLARASGFADAEVITHGGEKGDVYAHLTARRPLETSIRWEDISSPVEDSQVPFLDRSSVDAAGLSPEQRTWRQDGVLLLPKFLPDELIDRYCAVREKLEQAGGWKSKTPYLEIPEIKDICLYRPLSAMLEHLIGEPMGLHLNLTGWVSTERDWHQDDYLNPPFVSGYYAAVWMALDGIKPDAGPFQFVRGSHRWPLIRRDMILKLLDHDGRDDRWPIWSERLLTPFFEHEIWKRDCEVEQFLGERGDVLIWHARLVHRGSLPIRPGAERRALISHYSSIHRRPDMRRVKRHEESGYYFDLSDTGNETGQQTSNHNTLFSRWLNAGMRRQEKRGKDKAAAT